MAQQEMCLGVVESGVQVGLVGWVGGWVGWGEWGWGGGSTTDLKPDEGALGGWNAFLTRP